MPGALAGGHEVPPGEGGHSPVPALPFGVGVSAGAAAELVGHLPCRWSQSFVNICVPLPAPPPAELVTEIW